MSQYGDFEEIQTEESQVEQHEQPQSRVKLPRQNQLIGIVLERLGGKRMSIKSTDCKIRNCRVPGRFSRKFWLREGNIVIIEPWPDDNSKGDIVYQYRDNEIIQLKKRNLLDELNKS